MEWPAITKESRPRASTKPLTKSRYSETFVEPDPSESPWPGRSMAMGVCRRARACSCGAPNPVIAPVPRAPIKPSSPGGHRRPHHEGMRRRLVFHLPVCVSSLPPGQLANLLSVVRTGWQDRPQWPRSARRVARSLRRGPRQVLSRRSCSWHWRGSAANPLSTFLRRPRRTRAVARISPIRPPRSYLLQFR